MWPHLFLFWPASPPLFLGGGGFLHSMQYLERIAHHMRFSWIIDVHSFTFMVQCARLTEGLWELNPMTPTVFILYLQHKQQYISMTGWMTAYKCSPLSPPDFQGYCVLRHWWKLSYALSVSQMFESLSWQLEYTSDFNKKHNTLKQYHMSKSA